MHNGQDENEIWNPNSNVRICQQVKFAGINLKTKQEISKKKIFES